MNHNQKARRKAARSRMDRRKNCERLSKTCVHPSAASLPTNWQICSSSFSTEYFKLSTEPPTHVLSSVTIHQDGTWDVVSLSQKVNHASSLFNEFGRCVQSADNILRLIHQVDRASHCPANPEERFLEVCRRKGGKIKGERGNGREVGYLDDSATEFTVRSRSCDILTEDRARCKACNSLRGTLRSCISRQLNVSVFIVCISDSQLQ